MGFQLLTCQPGGERLRFAVHRPGIADASPRNHGVPEIGNPVAHDEIGRQTRSRIHRKGRP